MRIFFANLATETNTFSPIPTGHAAFTEVGYFRRDASLAPANHGSVALIEWRRLAEAEGHEVVESVCAFAQPAGTTLRGVYEALRDDILSDLRAAMPVDVVLMKMHGAMVADGYDDCEGDTLARIRAIVGTAAVIGCELDLHCHLTEEMRSAADAIITSKEYPHIDVAARARELYALCLATRRGDVRPAMAYHDCRMISMWRTTVEPMKSIVARMQAMEGRDGVLSISFGHGFPWGDVPEVGAKMVVITDGDMAKAERIAAEFASELWRLREECFPRHDRIDAGIDAALAVEGPVVLADVADNAGGGAPSDNTAILARLVARGVTGVVTGCYWDPIAVQFCIEAGEGATFDLRIGGKCGIASGQPVDLHVTVKAIRRAHTQRGLAGGRASLGDSVWVRADGIDLVLNSHRSQVFNPDAFTGLGLTLADKRIVVVKSTQHFHAGFAPVAREIRYVAAPGAIGPDFAAIPYTRRTRPYWPRVADPFATNS